MAEPMVGIRELKANLSRYLRSVRAGGALTITDRGRPIARLIPTSEDAFSTLSELIAASMANWDGQTLDELGPVATPESAGQLSDLLLEDRQ